MSSAKPQVLFVLTSTDSFVKDGKTQPTGWYLPEFAHPYHVLKDHADITIASPKGGKSPLEPSSVDPSKDDKVAMDFLENKKELWENTEKLETFVGRAKDFDAIFYVGGLGPMWDLATDPISQKIILEFHSQQKIVSAVCHGPAALANVKLADGSYFLAGQPVAGFSNSEEEAAGYTSAMPFSLEDKLNEASGGKYEKASQDWGEHAVTGHGGRLITGQNPASGKKVGELILEALKKGK